MALGLRCITEPIDIDCVKGEGEETDELLVAPSACSPKQALVGHQQPPPNTRYLDIETVQGSSHLSCQYSFSLSTKVIRPSVFLRQDPALRIPHSHSWCGAIGSPPPQGQEFQVQTDPQLGAASGRLRPAPSLVQEITSTLYHLHFLVAARVLLHHSRTCSFDKDQRRFHHSPWGCFFALSSNALSPLAYPKPAPSSYHLLRQAERSPTTAHT